MSELDGFERYEDSAWFAAIRAADRWRDATLKSPKKSGDLSLLVDLLRSKLIDARGDVTLTQDECELLIDLLSRHQLRQKQGGRTVPAYKRSSWAELKLEIAEESVRYYQSKGLSLKAAVERVTANSFVEEKALMLHIQNRLHPERRRQTKS
jgi:hypothetical protein